MSTVLLSEESIFKDVLALAAVTIRKAITVSAAHPPNRTEALGSGDPVEDVSGVLEKARLSESYFC